MGIKLRLGRPVRLQLLGGGVWGGGVWQDGDRWLGEAFAAAATLLQQTLPRDDPPPQLEDDYEAMIVSFSPRRPRP